MEANKVYKNIQKFASEPISFDDFMVLLKQTSRANPMRIVWQTTNAPSHRTSHLVAWGKNYTASEQSLTKAAEGMVNLEALDTREGWRTLTYDGIYGFTFKGKKYIIY